MSETKSMTVRIPEELYNEIKDNASRTGLTVTDMVISRLQGDLYSEYKNEYFSNGIIIDERMAINGLIAQIRTVYNTFININDTFNLDTARNELNKIACDWGFKCVRNNIDSQFKYDDEKYIVEFILVSVYTSDSRIDIGIIYKYGKLANGTPAIFINSFARRVKYD